MKARPPKASRRAPSAALLARGIIHGRHYSEWFPLAVALKARGEWTNAEVALWDLAFAAEAESKAQALPLPTGLYRELADLLRLRSRTDLEVALLARFLARQTALGLEHPEFETRYREAQSLAAAAPDLSAARVSSPAPPCRRVRPGKPAPRQRGGLRVVDRDRAIGPPPLAYTLSFNVWEVLAALAASGRESLQEDDPE